MAGLDEVGIVVRGAASLDATAARADAAGITVERRAGTIALRDPWGTRITLSA